MNLQELNKELDNIATGEEILRLRRERIELNIMQEERELKRAFFMQTDHLLQAEHENMLEVIQ